MVKNEYPDIVYVEFNEDTKFYDAYQYVKHGNAVEYRKVNDDEIIVKKSDIRENLFTPSKVGEGEDEGREMINLMDSYESNSPETAAVEMLAITWFAKELLKLHRKEGK
jgi:hypothetical protein